MSPKFAVVMETIHDSYEKLICSPPVLKANLIPIAGVYLFTENGRHLYVGRSNSMRLRYGQHRQPGSKSNQASFATLLTRNDLNLPPPTYAKGSGTVQRENPDYIARFTANKIRVSKMDFRCVEEMDQARQFLLEFYCAVALETPHNHFKTH